jgi:N-acetylmuramoyl-L-alanine amidase
VTPYVIRQGDYLVKLAARMGFDAATVWGDPKNKALADLRGDMNILRPGDVIYLPDPVPPVWLPANVGATNVYTAEGATCEVTLTLQYAGQPLVGASFTVEELPGLGTLTTGGGGNVTLTVPLNLVAVTLDFPDLGVAQRLRIGHLDPLTTPSGQLGRLRNLGFAADGAFDSEQDALSDAVETYQRMSKVDVTGELDAAAQDTLKTAHGC